MIPQQRIIDRMNEYMARRDFAGAERHLNYWLETARYERDPRGEMMVLGELVGHYRKTGNRAAAYACADELLALIDRLDFGRTIAAGTSFINVATAMCAFGDPERALPLFEKARAIYEASPETEPALLGGLFNNMGLALTALGRFPEAMALYEEALELMTGVPGGQADAAITLLNMADAVEASSRGGAPSGCTDEGEAEARINGLLDRAADLLDDPALPRDGYYSWVAEKCAPVFEYYGYFLEAKKLRARSTPERIEYAGS